MNNWQTDKAWSDRFLPEIKSILGAHLIDEPPIEEDAERNTDLIVLKLDAVRIACRVRHPQYFARYGGEFTIRASRPSRTKTELTKIIEGWGDYLFYGFANDGECALRAWFLADLKIFRLWFNRFLYANKGSLPGQEQKNHDGSSQFRAFKKSQMPPGFVIAEAPNGKQ